MAALEGVSRLRKVAQSLLRTGMVVTVAGTLLFLFVLLGHQPELMPLGMIVLSYLGFLPLLVGGLLRVCAWVIEGFLLPEEARSSPISLD